MNRETLYRAMSNLMTNNPDNPPGFTFHCSEDGVTVRDLSDRVVVIAKGYDSARLYLREVVIPKNGQVGEQQ